MLHQRENHHRVSRRLQIVPWIALLFASLLVPASLQAAERSFYVGGSLGSLEQDDIDYGFDRDDDYLKLFAGMRINRHLAVEVAYHDLGEDFCCDYIFDPLFDPVADVYGYRHEREAYSAAVLGIIPFDRFELFGKAGFMSRQDGSTFLGFPGRFDSSTIRGEVLAGIGAQVAIGEHFHVRAEWELLGIDDDSDGAGSVGLSYSF